MQSTVFEQGRTLRWGVAWSWEAAAADRPIDKVFKRSSPQPLEALIAAPLAWLLQTRLPEEGPLTAAEMIESRFCLAVVALGDTGDWQGTSAQLQFSGSADQRAAELRLADDGIVRVLVRCRDDKPDEWEVLLRAGDSGHRPQPQRFWTLVDTAKQEILRSNRKWRRRLAAVDGEGLYDGAPAPVPAL